MGLKNLSFQLQLFIIGKQENRTCSPVPINDCKVANSIVYCYCSWDNCNGKYEILSRELEELNGENERPAEHESNEESASYEDDFSESSSSDNTEIEDFDNFTTTLVYNNFNESEIHTKNGGIDCNFRMVLLLKLLYVNYMNFRKHG